MDPDEAARRFAERLEEAGLPRFASVVHDTKLDLLQITWDHGVTLFMDLTREEIEEPIGDHERAVILGLRTVLRGLRADRRVRARLGG